MGKRVEQGNREWPSRASTVDGLHRVREINGLRVGVKELEGFATAVWETREPSETVLKERVLLKSAFSGQMMFRVNPEVHRKAALVAELAGRSLNQWAEEVLGKAAGVRHGRT